MRGEIRGIRKNLTIRKNIQRLSCYSLIFRCSFKIIFPGIPGSGLFEHCALSRRLLDSRLLKYNFWSRYHTGNVFPRPTQARRHPDRGRFRTARQVPAPRRSTSNRGTAPRSWRRSSRLVARKTISLVDLVDHETVLWRRVTCVYGEVPAIDFFGAKRGQCKKKKCQK